MEIGNDVTTAVDDDAGSHSVDFLFSNATIGGGAGNGLVDLNVDNSPALRVESLGTIGVSRLAQRMRRAHR